MVDIVVRGDKELDELAFGPDVHAEKLGELDWPRPRRVHVPARLWRARAPPPDEGVAALGNAFVLGHGSSDASSNESGTPRVTGCHMEHCVEDLAVLGRRFCAKPLCGWIPLAFRVLVGLVHSNSPDSHNLTSPHAVDESDKHVAGVLVLGGCQHKCRDVNQAAP